MRGGILVAFLVLTSACEKKAPPDPHLQRGYALLNQDPRAALEEFEQARDPDGAPALVGRGLALEGLRRYSEAKKFLERAKGKGNDAGVYLLLARVEVMLGDLDAAQSAVDEVLEREKSVLAPLLVEAALADDRNRAKVALSHLDQWLEKRNNDEVKPQIPAEFYLARASLSGTLLDPIRRKNNISIAQEKNLSGDREAVALAVLASASGRGDLAVLLLRRLLDEPTPPQEPVQVGELAHRLGQHDLVAKVLAVTTGKSPELLALRAKHEFAKRSPRAVSALRDAVAKAQPGPQRDELRLLFIEALLRTSQLEQARRALKEPFSDDAFRGRAEVLQARIALASGKPKVALEHLRPVLGASPPDGAREVAALAHFEEKRLDEARELVRSLLKEQPRHSMAARMLVALGLQLGEAEQTEQEMAALVKRAPEHMKLRLLWIELIRKTKTPEKVTEALRKSVSAAPEQPQLWLMLADHLERQKVEGGGLAVLQEANTKNPRHPLIAAALAGALSRRGRNEEAAPLYSMVLEYSKDDVVALNNLAMFYIDELKEAERAVPLAERAYELNRSPQIADTLGWALFRRGRDTDLQRALRLLEGAYVAPASPTSQYHLGAVLLASGKVEKGRELLRQALASPGEFPEAEAARELLGRGS